MCCAVLQITGKEQERVLKECKFEFVRQKQKTLRSIEANEQGQHSMKCIVAVRQQQIKIVQLSITLRLHSVVYATRLSTLWKLLGECSRRAKGLPVLNFCVHLVMSQYITRRKCLYLGKFCECLRYSFSTAE